jgi:hypothetical protein
VRVRGGGTASFRSCTSKERQLIDACSVPSHMRLKKYEKSHGIHNVHKHPMTPCSKTCDMKGSCDAVVQCKARARATGRGVVIDGRGVGHRTA